jgi:hypothetical protein
MNAFMEKMGVVPPKKIKELLDPREQARQSLKPIEDELRKMLDRGDIFIEDIDDLRENIANTRKPETIN